MKSDKSQVEELRVIVRQLQQQICLLTKYNEKRVVDCVANDLLNNGMSCGMYRDSRRREKIRLDSLKEEYDRSDS